MEIFKIIFIVGFFYICAILITKIANNVTTAKAVDSVNHFIGEIIAPIKVKLHNWVNNLTESPNCDFGLYIGLDADGRPMSNVIDDSFKDLGKIFRCYYFWGVNIEKNRIIYSFFVSDPINNEMSEDELYEYCSSVCECVVHRIIHSYNPLFTHLDSLTAIAMHKGRLDLYIARNPFGQHENSVLSCQIRRGFKTSSFKETTPIKEDWEEE